MSISPSLLAEARDRANLTQSELAALLDVSLRTIVNWEADGGRGVPRKMEDRVRRYIGDALDQVEAAEQVAGQLKKLPLEALEEGGSTLARFSDVALLRELLRRAVQRRRAGEEHPDLGLGRGVIDFPPINVGDLSDDEIASIHDLAEKGDLAKAAGTDETAPTED
jgi:DNA-binding XRE family transcriptional regulator